MIQSQEIALNLLLKVEREEAYTDKILENLKVTPEVNVRFITELVNGTIRWQKKLDWLIDQALKQKISKIQVKLKVLLRLAAYELLFIEKVPRPVIVSESVRLARKLGGTDWAGLVNGVLRNIEIEPELPKDFVTRTSIVHSHPEWLVERWLEQFGENVTIDICKADNERPPITFRINYSMINEEEFFFHVKKDACKKLVIPGFYEIDSFKKIKPFLLKGICSIQDASAGIPTLLLNPQKNERILDACSAPGGKLTHIAEIVGSEAEIIAIDKYEKKLDLIKSNIKRLNLENIQVSCADAMEFKTEKPFDKILLDVPCTGLGVLAKRVDLRWKRNLQAIKNIQETQTKILDNISESLKVGGVLVYSTCSIDREENEEVVLKFLRIHKNFKLDDTPEKFVSKDFVTKEGFARTFPYQNGFDGSFAARIVRVN
ncbi:16S rRNA (cytosine(967)-C(5))-methyltransferase RsmB [bacterium]|nr:16S rRNA (cytosine(967)-C(5))-methyltransferase RsmB [bacterium]